MLVAMSHAVQPFNHFNNHSVAELPIFHIFASLYAIKAEKFLLFTDMHCHAWLLPRI